jgi:hypothetical protein
MAELKEETLLPFFCAEFALSRPLLLSLHTIFGFGKRTRWEAGRCTTRGVRCGLRRSAGARRGRSVRTMANLVDAKEVAAILRIDLRGNTPNVCRISGIICYLDPANFQDSICLGMNDTVTH